MDFCMIFVDCVVVPTSVRLTVLRYFHFGHRDTGMLKAIARGYAKCSGMDGSIEDLIRQYWRCQQVTKLPSRQDPVPRQPPKGQWSRLHLDFALPVDRVSYLILTDVYFSRFYHIQWFDSSVVVSPLIVRHMSVNYASGLSEYINKGVCGLPEFVDDVTVLKQNVNKLYRLMRDSKFTVVHTGAGISTSVGIPDFRGPKGVWTLEKLGQQPTVSVPFEKAVPSAAHRILVELEQRNIIHYLVTQNIDGLHLRSGFPRDRLSILHGDMFIEVCDKCGTFFVRNTPSTTMGLRQTNTLCSYVKPSGRCCRGKLCDTILDWESDLPQLDYARAIESSKRAELHICIGTSLQMYPAASLPLLPTPPKRAHNSMKFQSSKLVIINLQRTKLVRRACLNIHATADYVLGEIARSFGISLPSVQCSSDIKPFTPIIVLRSVHTTPSESLPWRLLPHPTHGSGINFQHSVATAKQDPSLASEEHCHRVILPYCKSDDQYSATAPFKRTKLEGGTDCPMSEIN
ncbi:hypothetical protein EG68_09169 [Paragonimus skrjabini miyazakii]|uniref:protein acetyllysine N-acetyltransferase n=1 Tax=Paragonimus skrjabini miyazakii TaxID=59628 RepID=A0A8S9YQD8_9TREM|nr:hypothetical protein EG68_09169 [Paragonimus skrjabini miyazakii]